MAVQAVAVPDIGDFADVPVIEVLVKPGDTVAKDQSVVVLESDKASMEVPSDTHGVVQDVRVKVGDKVSKGTVLLTLSHGEQRGHGEVSNHREASSGEASSGPAPSAQPTNVTQTIELKVPDIGDFTDVPVIEVLVKAGDTVEKDQSILVLESDKASMEVPASAAGVVEDVRVKVGDKVSQGAVFAALRPRVPRAPGDSAQGDTPVGDTTPHGTAAQQRTAAPQRAAASNGNAVSDAAALRQRVSSTAGNTSFDTPPTRLLGTAAGDASHASPSIRRFARELGVELQRVIPTGPNRRITRDDVQRFVKTALQHPTAAPPPANGAGLGLAPWPKVDFAQYGSIERKPLSRIQKLSGPNLHRNWVMIPHVTQNDDADVTDLEAFRKEINAERASSGIKVTMLSFLIRASIAALKKFPIFNSSLDGDEIVFKNYYNIGFAADTPSGLIVPVIRDADKKSLTEVAQETSLLAAKARDGKLSLNDMQGGTFTISSLGSIGGTYFTPIINAPEVAILGACKAAMRPVWDGNAFQPRLMQPLSLSYDHRVIDGAAAARFTAYVAEVLADLRRALV